MRATYSQWSEQDKINNNKNASSSELLSNQTENTNLNSNDETHQNKNQTKSKKSITKKTKSKVTKKSEDNVKKVKQEEINLENENDKVKIREIKSSTPIEVTQIDEKSNFEKPKKKGWWSK